MRSPGPSVLQQHLDALYPFITSIWVETPKGARIRVPFGDYDQTGMKFELGSFGYPETLYGSLAGPAAYLRR